MWPPEKMCGWLPGTETLKSAPGLPLKMSENVVFLSYVRNSAVNLFVPGGVPLPCTLEKLGRGMMELAVTLLLILIKLVLILAAILTMAAYLVLAERKILGRMQLRHGPNRLAPLEYCSPLRT